MADTFDKRQRAQRKARKRQEKLERRVQRNADKRYFTAHRSAGVSYTFRRGEADQTVDADVWLSLLSLAAFHGWTPLADTRELPPDAGSYARPAGLTIASDDAQQVAELTESEIVDLAEEEVELSDNPFGEVHTDALLARRIDGDEVDEDEVQAAREVLSGPTKLAAEELVEFLRGGSFSVDGKS